MEIYQQIKKDIPVNMQINVYLLVMGARPGILLMTHDVTLSCSLLDKFFRVFDPNFGTFYMNDSSYAYYLENDEILNSKDVGIILGYPFPYPNLTMKLDSFKLRNMSTSENYIGFRIARDTDTKFMREWAKPLTDALKKIDIYCEISVSSYIEY